ncbi:MAG: 4Fe-4S binding protein [Solidesulfovibrio sp. DCME]|uniref:4Fe-4S binding protein n=1 Tax=Solidesulfovibrio sp. DCME TaxID=3447380 RepID=UPI003D1232FD
MKRTCDALVVGAGIGGIRAALDLAEAGHTVTVIDKRPHIGGILTRLDHQFPSDHCGMCKMLPLTEREASSEFCLRKGLFHRNIDIMLSSELTALDGEPGAFSAVINRRSSFVDAAKCVGCGACASVCPVSVPSEFNAGLTSRGAVYLPVPHAIPNHYVVDLDACQRCWQCYEACPTGAIDFKLEERERYGILVVDPDPEAAGRFGSWLGALKFPVVSAATGDKALTILASDAPVRMMLLSPGLTDMEASRVLTRALELRPDLAVFVPGDPEAAEAARELLGLGARAAMPHPLSRKTFVPWLDKQFMRLASDTAVTLDVAAVILAGGFDCYDPGADAAVLGYGVLPGVVTSVEFERLLSGTGPTGGRLLRPGDGRPVRDIAWLQCVGSRDLRKNADFCSSFCCMASIKEAVLARRATGGEISATIFAMDVRAFGRDFERYRQEAETESGVRFVHGRLHTTLPDPSGDGRLRLSYTDEAGALHEESFDMLVLAVVARPPAGMENLAKAAGVDTNAFGFCATPAFDANRTSRLGVFAAGAMGGPRDIAESVIQAGAAALGASRIIKRFASIRERPPEARPVYRDVSREAPRTLVTLCDSCPTLERSVDVERVSRTLAEAPGVCQVERVSRACTKEGWAAITEASAALKPNRILIGACMPYAYVPKLRELGTALGLRPTLMDVVDIHTPAFSAAKGEAFEAVSAVEHEIAARLGMAAAKLLGADPMPLPKPLAVTPAALVVGGGLAGMTAALGIADHDYKVTLVEETAELGGLARQVRLTLGGGDPVRFLEGLIDRVRRHPNIRVMTEARVSLSTGKAGRFLSLISTDEGGLPLEHGVTILATGGRRAKVYDFGFLTRKTVTTHQDLERRLTSGELDTATLGSVAMIQCFRSRDENRRYCSRVCCAGALKNILYLKHKHPDLPIYVFYRDIMSYGFAEQYYTKARKAGAVFIRYDLAHKPQVRFDEAGKPVITGYDPVLRRAVAVHADLLSLSDGIEPGDTAELSEVFGVPVGPDGFFQEAESKWRPVDFLRSGIFVCGVARAPGSMDETVCSAKAAARRALRVLGEKNLAPGHVVASVRHSLCTRCGKCLDVCPYGARTLDPEHDRIVVDDILCQGCGSCASACPNSASFIRGFSDRQVLSVIDAALAVPGRHAPVPATDAKETL